MTIYPIAKRFPSFGMFKISQNPKNAKYVWTFRQSGKISRNMDTLLQKV